VQHVCERVKVSERRVCKVLGQSRATQRHEMKVAGDEDLLVKDMTRLATEYGRYGYRRITAMLRREGWRVTTRESNDFGGARA